MARCGTLTRKATNEVQILNKQKYVKRSNKPASCQTAVSGSAFSIYDLKCGNILNYDTAENVELLTSVHIAQNPLLVAVHFLGF